MAKGKDKGKKAPAEKPKKEGYKLSKFYEGGKSSAKFCPKCGPGYYLAQHKDRTVCGKCSYMERTTAKAE